MGIRRGDGKEMMALEERFGEEKRRERVEELGGRRDVLEEDVDGVGGDGRRRHFVESRVQRERLRLRVAVETEDILCEVIDPTERQRKREKRKDSGLCQY